MNDFDRLSVRAANVLYFLGIKTKKSAAKAVVNWRKIGQVRNCGIKTENEIRAWCGLPLKELPGSKTVICPHCLYPVSWKDIIDQTRPK